MLIDKVVLVAGFLLLEFGGVFNVFLTLQEVVSLGSYEIFVAEGVQHSGLTLFVGRF